MKCANEAAVVSETCDPLPGFVHFTRFPASEPEDAVEGDEFILTHGYPYVDEVCNDDNPDTWFCRDPKPCIPRYDLEVC